MHASSIFQIRTLSFFIYLFIFMIGIRKVVHVLIRHLHLKINGKVILTGEIFNKLLKLLSLIIRVIN